MKKIQLHVFLHVTITYTVSLIRIIGKSYCLRSKHHQKIYFFKYRYLQKFWMYWFEIFIIKNFSVDLYYVEILIIHLYRLPKSVMAGPCWAMSGLAGLGRARPGLVAPVRETSSSIYIWIETLSLRSFVTSITPYSI